MADVAVNKTDLDRLIKSQSVNPFFNAFDTYIVEGVPHYWTGSTLVPKAVPPAQLVNPLSYRRKRKFIMIAGQSNTDYGRQFLAPEPLAEVPSRFRNMEMRLKALVRSADNQGYTLMPAQFQLLDQSQTAGHGYGYVLGRYILETMAANEELILVQVAVGGTGWSNNRWGPMNDLWQIYVEQLRYVTQTLDAECLGIFWNQGETDAAAVYAPVYEHLINNLAMMSRKILGDATGDYAYSDLVPFVTFDMVPGWVGSDANRLLVQNALTNIVSNIPYAGNADTSALAADLETDQIHYDSRQMMQLARLMFEAWGRAKLSTTAYPTIANGEYLLFRQTAPTAALAVGSGGNIYDHLAQNVNAADPLAVSLYSILGRAWQYENRTRRVFKYRYETVAGAVPQGVTGDCVFEQAYTPFSFTPRLMPAALISTTRAYGMHATQGFNGLATTNQTNHTSMSLCTLSTSDQYWAPIGQVGTFLSGSTPSIPVYQDFGAVAANTGYASEVRLYAILD